MNHSRPLLLAALSLLSGCVEVATHGRGPVQVEVVTIDQQALDAVTSTPTEFAVRFGQDGEAWSRAKVFFLQYTGGLEIVAEKDKRVSMNTSSTAGDRYHFAVQKRPTPDGYLYRVLCRPQGSGATQQHARMNAQNLARFVRTGTLEVALLKR